MLFDWTYLYLVLPAVIFSIIMSSRVNSVFDKFSKVFSIRGITAAEAVDSVLKGAGVVGVKIERVRGKLTDHFDPRSNTIRLSETVYDSTSVAAIGVACHEAGHAIQYAEHYVPIKLRNMIIPITNIGSRLSVPLILIGLALSYMGQAYVMLAYIGVALFGLCVIFQLLTLFAEFDASNRAMNSIRDNLILDEQEMVGTKKVLSAAAMTYVAALAVTLMQFLRLLLLVSGRSSRRR